MSTEDLQTVNSIKKIKENRIKQYKHLETIGVNKLPLKARMYLPKGRKHMLTKKTMRTGTGKSA